jgi:hypothetical protein
VLIVEHVVVVDEVTGQVVLGASFRCNPFSLEALAFMVREVLDEDFLRGRLQVDTAGVEIEVGKAG